MMSEDAKVQFRATADLSQQVNVQPCCKPIDNRKFVERRNEHFYVFRCVECGRRHIEFHAPPGDYRAVMAPLGRASGPIAGRSD